MFVRLCVYVMCVRKCVLCKLGTEIEMQSVELYTIHVHVTMFVSESVCTIIRQVYCCHMYNWCVQVRCT